MISLRKLTFARGGVPLVENASQQLHAGWKVGLTGANGSGKSSFFALVRGELHAEAGEIELPPTWIIAHVAQETPALPAAALEFTLDGDRELRAIEQDLASAEQAHQGDELRCSMAACRMLAVTARVPAPRSSCTGSALAMPT